MRIAVVYTYRVQFAALLRSSFFYGMVALTLLVSVLSYFNISDPFSFSYEARDLLSSFVPLVYFLLINHGKLHGTAYSAHSNKLYMSPWMVFPMVYVGTLFADFIAIASMPSAGYTAGTTSLFADILRMLVAGQYHFLAAPYALSWIGGAGLEDGLLTISLSAAASAFGLAWLMRGSCGVAEVREKCPVFSDFDAII
jgi:hypothetical protein